MIVIPLLLALVTVIEEPVPVRVITCGDPAALSVTETTPVRLPVTVGVKVTEIVQLAPAARLLPHVLVSAKSSDATMDVTLSAV